MKELKIDLIQLSYMKDLNIELVFKKYIKVRKLKGININTIRSSVRRMKMNIKLIQYVREKGGCIGCGEDNYLVLDFDHRCPKTKLDNISNMVRSFGWVKIKLELDKCDILCSNCHRIKTAKQLGYHIMTI